MAFAPVAGSHQLVVLRDRKRATAVANNLSSRRMPHSSFSIVDSVSLGDRYFEAEAKTITYLSEFVALGFGLGSFDSRQTSRSRRALTTASDFEWTCSLR